MTDKKVEEPKKDKKVEEQKPVKVAQVQKTPITEEPFDWQIHTLPDGSRKKFPCTKGDPRGYFAKKEYLDRMNKKGGTE
jgi:hypothetical protein